MFRGHTKIDFFAMKLTFFVSFAFVFLFASSAPTYAEAKASSLSLGIETASIEALVTPLSDGTFGETNTEVLTVGTDNYSGYSLSIKALNGTNLVSTNGGTIESIDSSITEYAFVRNSEYNNKWGFKPSQYVDGGNTVNNNRFLPIPSGQGLLIAKSTSANSTVGGQLSTDTYSFSSGARVDNTLLAGPYSNTYLVSVLANAIVYNITYDANAEGAITNMPSPNPQPITIDGDTPLEESYVNLSDAIPQHDQKGFIGWCDEVPTHDSTSGQDICSGNLYFAGDRMPVDQTAEPNIVLYGVWNDSKFPIVWSHRGACEFHGATNGNITGSECTEYHDTKFIDTGIALYSNLNYMKDYEMHFKFDHYEPSEQVDYFGTEDGGQQTFANDKPEVTAGDGRAPGAVIRRNGNTVEFSSKNKNEKATKNFYYRNIQEMAIYRINGKIYYQINNDPLVLFQDITDFNQQFGLNAWFGAYPRDNCDGNQGVCTDPKRIPEATLSDMYIRLGDYPDENVNKVDFVLNSVSSDIVTSYLLHNGDAIKTLPSAPNYNQHIFQGWFTERTGGTKIDTSTVPTGSTTYYAHWLGTVELAIFESDYIQASLGETSNIVVTNSSDLEPYVFTSDDTSIVTVDANTGEITPVGIGSATVKMKGTLSNKTKTVTIDVASATYNVTFDSQGGSSVNNISVLDGRTIDPLPVSYLSGFQFEGWYTEPNGAGTKLSPTTVFRQDMPTTYYANWEVAVTVCKAATVQHTETCNRSSNGCKKAGYSVGSTISYGTLITAPGTTPVAGDAFSCDIDGDHNYDEDNERFYFFGVENGKAKFVYYKNIADVNVSYSAGFDRLPVPSTPGWTNTNLVPYSSGDFAGKIARYMSRGEAYALCGNSTTGLGSNGKCLYLLEKSNFSDTLLVDGWWLGGTNNSRIHTATLTITDKSGVNAVRPVIEVPMSLIEY